MVTSLLPGSKGGSRGHKSQEPKAHQRLDIQGLRMVAVTLVVLSHLFHWPRGGFIGVDVFFVISGFLITGSLLHTLEKNGRISFSSFYRRRVRRIVPAATLVLAVTCVAAYLIFPASRFKSIELDAVAAFFFVSNWRFGIEGTDYFNASGAVSPLQHYWSLSVEEQFYFIWPAVILAIGLMVTHKSWSRRARLALSASVMGAVVSASFVYSFLDTASNPTWAYFSTLTRVWELGIGALLAITISLYDRIPDAVRPVLAWLGLIMITLGAFTITEAGGGFPAPLAAVPVLGAALVITAGVRGEHRFLGILTNRLSTYVGDISYSLYLWHWPSIILLGALMDRNGYYFAASLFLMFGLSIAAYHFFENPIRASKWLATVEETKDRSILDRSRWRLPTLKMSETNQGIGIGALALVTAGLAAYALTPSAPTLLPPAASAGPNLSVTKAAVVGPEQAKLTAELNSALKAEQWPPDLTPTMDEVISESPNRTDVSDCGGPRPPALSACTWGSTTAPHTLTMVGDSTSMAYAEAFKWVANNSNGAWKVQLLSMTGCSFMIGDLQAPNQTLQSACPGRVASEIQSVGSARPDIVVVTNNYADRKFVSTGQPMSLPERTDAVANAIAQIASHASTVIMLPPPPADKELQQCYTRRSAPTDCVTTVTTDWLRFEEVDRNVADRFKNANFLETRRWFCSESSYCPAFAGTLPTKRDKVHVTPDFSDRLGPVVRESLRDAGLGV
ncbi:acyltransferase [Rhodococcus sp. A14]|nr:acyltransferase [Rhodococcus sp. A14]